MATNRIKWADFSKGLAIVLVIVGHTVKNPILLGTIFSVHMPLFFIAAGYTSRCSESFNDYTNKLKNSAKHLLVPAYIIYLIRLPLYIFLNHKSYCYPNVLLTPIFASGVDVMIGNMLIPAFGMMWFLVVLFGVKALYGFIYLKYKNIMFVLSIILSFLGMLIGRFCFLPFDIDLIMATLLFFYVGQRLKKFDLYSAKLYVYGAAFGTWAIGLAIGGFILHSFLELAVRRYPLYALSYITAIGGCIFIFLIGVYLEKINKFCKIFKIFCFLGENSMVLFTIHAFDTVGFTMIEGKYSTLILLILRLTVDLFIMYLYLVLKKKLRKSERKCIQ